MASAVGGVAAIEAMTMAGGGLAWGAVGGITIISGGAVLALVGGLAAISTQFKKERATPEQILPEVFLHVLPRILSVLAQVRIAYNTAFREKLKKSLDAALFRQHAKTIEGRDQKSNQTAEAVRKIDRNKAAMKRISEELSALGDGARWICGPSDLRKFASNEFNPAEWDALLNLSNAQSFGAKTAAVKETVDAADLIWEYSRSGTRNWKNFPPELQTVIAQARQVSLSGIQVSLPSAVGDGSAPHSEAGTLLANLNFQHNTMSSVLTDDHWDIREAKKNWSECDDEFDMLFASSMW
jgi:hypothetical protein